MKRLFGLMAVLMFASASIGCCCSHLGGYNQGCGYSPCGPAPAAGGCPSCAPTFGQPGAVPQTGMYPGVPAGATIVAETPIYNSNAPRTAKAPREPVPTYE